MKLLNPNDITKKCLLNRYVNGYTLHDAEYEKIKATLFVELSLIKNQNELLEYLESKLGVLDEINEGLYYDLIAEYIEKRLHQKPTADLILNIL